MNLEYVYVIRKKDESGSYWFWAGERRWRKTPKIYSKASVNKALSFHKGSYYFKDWEVIRYKVIEGEVLGHVNKV